MKRDAIISECENYRYSLSRDWDDNKEKVLFIMLNPSVADDVEDDRTITRCINFAKDWGYGGLMVGNLFAYRTTYPKELFKTKDPEGKDNLKHIKQMIKSSDLVICAWGNKQGMPPKYLRELTDLHYLKLLADGKTPGHPLFLKKDTKPTRFNFLGN
tara:strand:- start:37 stop:507 length:471 start_codon:yes stop_codon:yes gene_type:complete